MRVLCVGGGAREHALAEAISKECKLFSVMDSRNPGIMSVSEDFKICDITDAETIRKFAESNDVSMAVVGPSSAMAAGVTDSLNMAGIDCIGAEKTLARVESDKAYCRSLMEKYAVKGCPKFGIFTDEASAYAFLDTSNEELVVKPAGLTDAKEVRLMGEHLRTKQDVKAYIHEIIHHRVGGMAKVVIEEKLAGEEFTLQTFVDGERVVPMPAVRDHKRAFEDDVGPNTGGMGSYSDANHRLPFLKKKDYATCLEIMESMVAALRQKTGFKYRGFLSGQFMVGQGEPKVVAFNACLGDPEALNVIPILEGSISEIFGKIVSGSLNRKDVKFKSQATVCKYAAPQGYPTDPKISCPLSIDELAIKSMGARLYYGTVAKKNKRLVTSYGRTLATVGIAEDIPSAERLSERALGFVKGDVYHRRDIGKKLF